jgi:hypothetical protein
MSITFFVCYQLSGTSQCQWEDFRKQLLTLGENIDGGPPQGRSRSNA